MLTILPGAGGLKLEVLLFESKSTESKDPVIHELNSNFAQYTISTIQHARILLSFIQRSRPTQTKLLQFIMPCIEYLV